MARPLRRPLTSSVTAAAGDRNPAANWIAESRFMALASAPGWPPRYIRRSSR